MTAIEPWTADPKMRAALMNGIRTVRGFCDRFDPDAVIGCLVEAGYCIIPTPEPLGPPRARPDPRHISDLLPGAVSDLEARKGE